MVGMVMNACNPNTWEPGGRSRRFSTPRLAWAKHPDTVSKGKMVASNRHILQKKEICGAVGLKYRNLTV